MRNKIMAMVALFGMSFTTFAQTNGIIVIGNNDKSQENTEESISTSKTEKDEVANEDNQVMTMAKTSGKKDWSDRTLAGKILIIAGCAVIVVLAILLPEGYSSRG